MYFILQHTGLALLFEVWIAMCLFIKIINSPLLRRTHDPVGVVLVSASCAQQTVQWPAPPSAHNISLSSSLDTNKAEITVGKTNNL